MREQSTRTRRARPSVVQGARHATRVVTAAALIMFSVFASFVTTEDATVRLRAKSDQLGLSGTS